MIPGVEHKRLRAPDGTEIAYQVRGRGPAVVLANGLGGFYKAYKPIYDALGESYRVISWDYRGIFRSGVPRDRRTLAVPYHAGDLELILEREGIDRAVFVGWSMGVQVNFEVYRRCPERMDGLVAIGGTYGSPFRTVLSSPAIEYALPPVLKMMRAQAPVVNRLTRTLAGWRGLIPVIKRLGVVSGNLDEPTFREVLDGFSTVDWKVYGEALAYLGAHDAREVLPEIDVPTLIVAGDRDFMVPVAIAKEMQRGVPGSRLVVVEGGTHYMLMEYPALFREEVLAHLARIPGYEPAGEIGAPGAAGAFDTRAGAGG